MATIETPSEALLAMLQERDMTHAAAQEFKRLKGWRGSPEAAHSQFLQKFQGYGGPHQGVWLNDAWHLVGWAGEDPVSPFFVEAAHEGEVKALRRRLEIAEHSLDRPGIRAVRRERRMRDVG